MITTICLSVAATALLVPFIKVACEHTYPTTEVLLTNARKTIYRAAMFLLGGFLALFSLGCLMGALYFGAGWGHLFLAVVLLISTAVLGVLAIRCWMNSVK